VKYFHACRFKRRQARKALKYEQQNTSIHRDFTEKPRWRLLISQVFLGSCYIEKTIGFKDFMYTGEEKVVQLLRFLFLITFLRSLSDGYNSIYFEREEAFLVLLSEHCVPIYLCEYYFDECRNPRTTDTTFYYTSTS